MPQPRDAGDVMSKPVEWASPSQTLAQVARIMVAKWYSQLPVRDGDKYLGRVTEDVIRDQLEQKKGDFESVADLRVRDLPKVGSKFKRIGVGTGIIEVIKILKSDQAVLVEEGSNKADWGIITRSNLLKYF